MTPLELFEELSPFAIMQARITDRRTPPNVEFDDLRNAALFGLWKAVCRHSHLPDDDIRRLARSRIRGAILDELRTQSFSQRPRDGVFRRVEHLEDSPRDAAPPHQLAVDDATDRDNILDAKKLLASLPPRLRSIMSRRLAWVTAADIARTDGVSPERISQLTAEALRRIDEFR